MSDVVLSGQVRLAETGPVLGGTPGDVLTIGADGRTVSGQTPAGGGAPLPRTYWVSPLSTTTSPDGSDENPFLTPQDGVDALEAEGVGGVLLLACSGNAYNALDLVVTSVDVALQGFGNSMANSADRPFLNSITIAGGVRFTAQNLGCLTFNVSPGAGATLGFDDFLWLGATFQDCTIRRMWDCDGAVSLSTALGAGNVTLGEAVNCRLSGVGSVAHALTSARLQGCIVTGGIGADDLVLVETDVVGAGGDIVSATTLEADSFSLASMRANGAAHVVGTLTISDRPLTTGLVFTVPALAAAFADVTAALVGIKPGDTFDVTTTARLADVGIVDAFCDVADVLTLRFFGTTAGGDVTCNVNVNANSP